MQPRHDPRRASRATRPGAPDERERFVTTQDRYNLLNREKKREMDPLCVDQGAGVVPWIDPELEAV